MHIGAFVRTPSGYQGRLTTLALDVPLCFAPASEGGNERAPDWRIHLGEDASGSEVGAGWNHNSPKVGAFVAIQLDCPTLPRPLRANLLRASSSETEHVLLWSPRMRRAKSE